jgi:NADH:ubiquinone oxidoreductase subunit E
MKTLRRYWENHNGEASPLLRIHHRLRSKSAPWEAAEVKNLAEEVGLPEATVRSVISYYADLHGQQAQIRICQGTSCLLAGASQLKTNLAQKYTCKDVYCLGYCDRSPAFLNAQEEIVFGKTAQAIDNRFNIYTGRERICLG